MQQNKEVSTKIIELKKEGFHIVNIHVERFIEKYNDIAKWTLSKKQYAQKIRQCDIHTPQNYMNVRCVEIRSQNFDGTGGCYDENHVCIDAQTARDNVTIEMKKEADF